MRCPSCGYESGAGERFCRSCGASLVVQAPAAPPQYAPPPQPQPSHAYVAQRPSAPPAPGQPRKKGRGCLYGCLSALAVLILLAACATAVFIVPGLLPSDSSRYETTFPDGPEAGWSSALAVELEQAGQPSRGMRFYVLPVSGKDYSDAYVVLDQSKGYQSSADYDPVKGTFCLVANSAVAKDANVRRVAIEFRDKTGKKMWVMTAPVDAIVAWGKGDMDDKAFMHEVYAKGDLVRALATANGQ